MEKIKNYIKTDKYAIYNKEAASLGEIASNTVDLIITGPAYNIGHIYLDNIDKSENDYYIEYLKDLLKASYRVLKDEALLVIDVAELIFHGNRIFLSASFFLNTAKTLGFKFLTYFPYHTNKIEGVFNFHTPSDANSYCETPLYDHSSTQLILIFKKTERIIDSFSYNYQFNKIYPENPIDEAFWPDELVEDLCKNFDVKNKVLLEPYLGSGAIGIKAIQNDCFLIGYEKSEKLYAEFINKL